MILIWEEIILLLQGFKKFAASYLFIEDNFDCAILCGAYAVLDEELAFSDWHNY